MIRRPPRSTQSRSSAASDVYKRQVVANAEKKLVSKHADLVVANEVGGGRAFGADDNVVWFVDDQDVEELPRMSKTRLADEILNKAMQFLA